MGGYDPYSASKGCAELIVASYQQSFFPVDALEQHKIKIATARAGNVIGGGDWAKDRIVCDIIRNIIQKKSIGLRNPSAIRPWQHVLEPLNAYLLLAAKMSESYDPVYCSPWNFGPRSAYEVSVANLVSLMYKQWKQDYVWQEEKSLTAPKESQILRLYTHKASKQLNWKPKWNLEKAIEKTVTWYQRYYTQSQQNMLNISFEQIEEHMHARD